MNSNIQKEPFILELKKKARMDHIPLYGGFELTSRCNLNCKMCYVHDSNAAEAKARELSTEQWKRIFDDAIDAGMMFALLTGGECLLREDFNELYLYLYNKGVYISVNTNATLIDAKRVEFFKNYMPEKIQISIYGLSEDAYECVTERRKYESVSNAIELLCNAGIQPHIAITPSKYMKDYREILEYTRSKNLPYTINPVLLKTRSGASISDCYLTEEEIIAVSRAERELLGKKLKQHDTSPPKPGGSSTDVVYGIPCNAGTIRAAFTSDGMMIPCFSIPDIRIDVLKHGFNNSWEYIWKKMTEVVQPSMCNDCEYRRYCVYCPAMRYDGLFSGRCKQELCTLMIKKYEEGII